MTRSTTATPTRRRPARGVALFAASAAALAGVLAGCSAGNETQTTNQVAPIPGVDAQSADGKIAVRDVQVAFAMEYPAGGSAPLNLRIFNDSTQEVTLTGMTTSTGGTVVLVGGASAPASSPPVATTPPAGSAAPGTTVTPSRPANGSGSATPPAGSATPATPSPAATTGPPPLPGSTAISVPIPATGYALLVKGTSERHLAIASLPAKLVGGGHVVVTLTFRYADGSTTTIDSLRVPIGTPGSPLPRITPSEAKDAGGH